ncbi:MAG: 4-hydroxy-tetrahydrodipicolinate reductase, partial [Clostridiales bacterium]|nr:4-hydroxy-tetrahydrodipicolinate reductase [Clostridiales bacterium]
MKIIICGLNGKMGQAVYTAAISAGHSVAAGIDGTEAAHGVPLFKDFSGAPEADVIIDFSRPSALNMLLGHAVKTKTPLVLATTGYSEAETEAIQAAAKKTAVFFSRNMSLGISLLSALCEKAAKVLGAAFEVEIIEKHHNQKADAPSGTALMLAEAVKSGRSDGLNIISGRAGSSCKRQPDELGIHSVRGGGIIGEHEVMFIAPDEIITLSHSAYSRAIFAKGAISAAEYLK